MADNIVVTPGTGATMAADEVVDATLGTVKVGYGKIMDGTPDSTNKLVVTASGAAKVDGSGVTQPVSGTVTVANPTTNPETGLAKDTSIGSLTETAPATDTASSGLNGRLQRIAQRLTTLIGLLPTALGAGGGLKVDGSGTPLPVSGTVAVSNATFPVTDNSGSLTVDAPVATPVFVRLSDGAAAIATLPVSLASLPALVAGSAIIGKVGIDQTTPGTTNAVTDTKLPASAASADALTNPTITQIGADNMLFNGSTWDRQRGMSVATTTGDTGAKTATGNGATQTNVGNKGVSIVIVLGTVSGTTPTCVFKIQSSVDGGTTWVDVPGATTASLTATGNFGIDIYPGAAVTAGTTTTGTKAVASQVLPRTWRVVWTIGGTTPSFTITSITYNYIPN